MSGEQHKIVGIGVGIASCYLVFNLTKDLNSIMLLSSSLGCWLPDIDHDRTKLGRKRKKVSKFLDNIIKYGSSIGICLSMLFIFLLIKGIVDYTIKIEYVLYFIASCILILVMRKSILNSPEYKWAKKHRGIMHTLIATAPFILIINFNLFTALNWFIQGIILGYVSHLITDCLTEEGCPLLYPISKSYFSLHLCKTPAQCNFWSWLISIGSVILSYSYINYFARLL